MADLDSRLWKITNISGSTVVLAELSVTLLPGEYQVIYRSPYSLTGLAQFQAELAAERIMIMELPGTSVPDSATNQGTITAVSQSVPLVTVGMGNARVRIGGTWVGTLQFEGTVDGQNWSNFSATPIPQAVIGGSLVTSTSTNGTWEIRTAGLQQWRVRASAWTSGTATVALQGSVVADYVLANIMDDGIVVASTTTTLAHDATWTTGTIDMLPYVSVSAYMVSDRNSAVNGILAEDSMDGVTWTTDHTASYTSPTPMHYIHNRRARYMRLTYTNGNQDQTIFRAQIIAQRVSQQVNNVHLSQALFDSDSGVLNRSVITGRSTQGGGTYVNVKVNPSGALSTDMTGSTVGLTVNPNSAVTSVSSSATTVVLLAANASRQGAMLYNDSAQVLYVKLGSTASLTSFTKRLAAGEYWEVPFRYSGPIHGIWASADGAARITEITG